MQTVRASIAACSISSTTLRISAPPSSFVLAFLSNWVLGQSWRQLLAEGRSPSPLLPLFWDWKILAGCTTIFCSDSGQVAGPPWLYFPHKNKDVAVLPLFHPACGLELRGPCFSQSCNEKVSRKMLERCVLPPMQPKPCLCVVSALPQPPLPKTGKKCLGALR